jgi:hypothetical protein
MADRQSDCVSHTQPCVLTGEFVPVPSCCKLPPIAVSAAELASSAEAVHACCFPAPGDAQNYVDSS